MVIASLKDLLLWYLIWLKSCSNWQRCKVVVVAILKINLYVTFVVYLVISSEIALSIKLQMVTSSRMVIVVVTTVVVEVVSRPII